MTTATKQRKQPRRVPGKRPKRRLPVWALGAAVVAALVVALVLLRDDAQRVGVGGGVEDQVAHVHGLGINPADGELYAATHYGLFRFPETGEAVRVSEAVQDTMGFTVVAGDHFLGSGHPDPKDKRLRVPGKPPLLGLIESTDGGRTWDPVSLLGEVDFHSLSAVHDVVYGYDSTGGRLMVSPDGKSWDTRAEIPIADFSVDPADADHLVAMTENGLAESRDGGRKWSSIPGPQLVFLTWHESEGLWGVGPDGATYERTEEGWEPRAPLPGQPQELLVTDNELYAAAADERGTTGIYVSTDRGGTWELRYSDAER